MPQTVPMPFSSECPFLRLTQTSNCPALNMSLPLFSSSGVQRVLVYDIPQMLIYPWLLQYSSLAVFLAYNPVTASIATVEPMEKDEKEEEDSKVDVEEGFYTEDLVQMQVPAEVE